MGDPDDQTDPSLSGFSRVPETANLRDAESGSLEAVGDAAGQPVGATGTDLVEGLRRVGRYLIERVLGEGGYGTVYRAYDEILKRVVAIKVPHRRLVVSPEHVELYITEAQVVAKLDHPNIVPVYDAGRTEDGLCFVVSKFVEGTNLTVRIKDSRLSHRESAEIVATIAEALHHAHLHRVVHRDVKPGNILVDSTGRPYVADFGLALTDEHFGKGSGDLGTVAYMSPEQARGEGHRVDGRSDVFSLGVVLYELLTGTRPFRGKSNQELIGQIKNLDVRPPRQLDDSIPKRLERICLKAMAKRATHRYATALDMAEDLRHFLRRGVQSGEPTETAQAAADHTPPVALAKTTESVTPVSDVPKPIRVIPKGLRSFDAQDADFFLELLPGPYDRDGVPESIRFWKQRVEEADPDKTFRVGLIYGPSGCGKSSLVKAGLLPRLAGHVHPVYIEAAADETAARLLRGLRKRCPQLPDDLNLIESMAALRRGRGVSAGKKVLIVLDQFEQWLHATRGREGGELVEALRHCDGERVQCVVMVRDDFWLAVSRFMQELEIRLVEGQNSALIDLFDLRHTKKVLTAFGRAFGTLPGSDAELTSEQAAFLEEATTCLAEEEKVVCVRLALFAEMMKGKPWIPVTLRAVGGIEGVGFRFLEETFSVQTAPPEHRYHQKAARGVLKCLLPEHGTNIKGHLRSYQALLESAGYARRPQEFADLLRILDGELRLVTPTDPEGVESEDGPQTRTEEKYYQLTHDYLVPSVREWLTSKQKATRRGRAELRLSERASLWNARPENRHLPAWWELLNIRLFTSKKDWTEPQKKMMRAAGKHHAVRGLLWALAGVLLGWGGYEGYGALRATSLVDMLITAETSDVSGIVEELSGYHRWAASDLRRIVASSDDPKACLHASLALLSVDQLQVDYLYERLLKAAPSQVPIIVTSLADDQARLVERLWDVLEDVNRDTGERLRAACALAAYTPDDPRWKRVGSVIATKLVTENPLDLQEWTTALRPVSRILGPAVADIIQSEKTEETRRIAACDILATYAVDDSSLFQELERWLKELQRLRVDEVKNLPLGELRSQLTGPSAIEFAPVGESTLAKRQANVAAALLRMNQYQRMREVLKHTSDPTARSHLIHRFASLAIDPKMLWTQLRHEQDVSIRRALILGIGELGPECVSPSERDSTITLMVQWYREDPDPGIHGATEWLLRHWNQEGKVREITKELATGRIEGDRLWYINRQGQTMVLIGSPTQSMEAEELEKPSTISPFAIADKDVTVAQYLRFRNEQSFDQQYRPQMDCPMGEVSWRDAAAYCNWLSEQEGIPKDQWCYEPNSAGWYAGGMKIRLGRRGYRLPSDAEWLYACRAGAATYYWFGESEELLAHYECYARNSRGRAMPVGTLKPNDFGLFDLAGNVQQWCQDAWPASTLNRSTMGGAKDGRADDEEEIDNVQNRRLRGGAFNFLAASSRWTAEGGNWGTWNHWKNIGFRPARTVFKAE